MQICNCWRKVYEVKLHVHVWMDIPMNMNAKGAYDLRQYRESRSGVMSRVAVGQTQLTNMNQIMAAVKNKLNK